MYCITLINHTVFLSVQWNRTTQSQFAKVSEYSKQINNILSLIFVYISFDKYSTTILTTSLSVAMEIGGMWWGFAAVSGRLIALAAFYLPPPCVVGVGFPSYLLVAPLRPFLFSPFSRCCAFASLRMCSRLWCVCHALPPHLPQPCLALLWAHLFMRSL